MNRPRAILLLGPTGSGKTPLGDWLQTHGLTGQPCRHFDFGAHLRAGAGLTEPERDYVRQLLVTGALLENDAFYIAEKILRAFLAGKENALIILNGLPRHTGQATALEPILDVVAVVHLQADAATIHERLGRNSGGDRTGRTDDDLALVERKLAIFTARTLPLLDHYRCRGAFILVVPITVTTTPIRN